MMHPLSRFVRATRAERVRVGRSVGAALAFVLMLVLGASIALAETEALHIEIQSPPDLQVFSSPRASVDVEGIATLPGAVETLDLMLVIDNSRSLRNADPYSRRIKGALILVDTLRQRGDMQIGLVGLSRESELLVPLTDDRKRLADALRGMTRGAFTEVDEGLRLALDELDEHGRQGASHEVLLLTDGRSDADAIQQITNRARERGAILHTLFLGNDEAGLSMLETAAAATNGTFQRVNRANDLPDLLADFHTTGIEHVTLSVNESTPVPVELDADHFALPMDLTIGENRIVATATRLNGASLSDAVTVTLEAPDCGRLHVGAHTGGVSVASLGGRTVEIILDSSGSMWGRTDGRIKLDVAKSTLRDLLGWLPPDTHVGLRTYGHRQARDVHDCRDSERLVSPGTGNRDRLTQALAGLKPRGQTPIAYALYEAGQDLRKAKGERAIVLVTDGVESCGGDANAVARTLADEEGVPVHVIGFDLAGGDGDVARLRAIAESSGGRFFTPDTASGLRSALGSTVGTPWTITQDGRTVASGALGSEQTFDLPSGAYELELGGRIGGRIPVQINSGQASRLSIEQHDGQVSHTANETPLDPLTCTLPRTP